MGARTTGHRIEVLTSTGCPHAEQALRLVQEVAARLLPGCPVERVVIDDEDRAQSASFPGSPTVRVDGMDLEGPAERPAALACRLYQGGSGVPPVWMVEAACLRALRPKHVLFLCVANSARSQMAEGIARALAPEGLLVSSAGSAPSAVRPLAVQALSEIGIDISAHRSKGVEAVDAQSVEAVITLCAEEVCPVFLGRAIRLHWGLADPAAAEGTEEDKLRAFRAGRDELERRLKTLFAGWDR